MTNYEKGRNGEYYVRGRLQTWGYLCERMASSKPFDLLIADDTDVWAAEVKRQELSDAAVLRIWDELEMYLIQFRRLHPVLFYKENGRWVYLDEFGKGTLSEWSGE